MEFPTLKNSKGCWVVSFISIQFLKVYSEKYSQMCIRVSLFKGFGTGLYRTYFPFLFVNRHVEADRSGRFVYLDMFVIVACQFKSAVLMISFHFCRELFCSVMMAYPIFMLCVFVYSFVLNKTAYDIFALMAHASSESSEKLIRGKFCQRGSNSDSVFYLFVFQFIRGKKIKVPLKAGHHCPANETQFNDVSLAG